tara:strand:- start:443 stop:1936 length:1494 start_codon:yes stop_codon:yes gene_type:complete
MIKQFFLNVIVVFLFSSEMVAQENVFHSRDFWKANPSLEQIDLAIAEGNDPSALNENAFDGVVFALLEKTDATTIKYLLSLEGNGIEKRTHDSRTYIFWAAYKGNINIMQYLLDKGAVINSRDSHGNTPVTFAAATGQKSETVYDLFEKNGAVLYQEKNEDEVGVLFLIAPYLENESKLAYFQNKGFIIHDKDPKGNTIFNHAAKSGNIDFLKLLIKKGLSPTVLNKEGGNAILYASQGTRKHQNTIGTYQFLEAVGVKVNVVGDRGRNPLHAIAYKSKDISVFKYFIDKGVVVNLQDNGGDTPFMNAANSNDLKVVQFLSAYVKDFNTKDENGRSALAMAVNRNTVAIVKFLLDKGADIHTKDAKGNSLTYYLLDTFNKKDPKEFDAKLMLLQEYGLSLNQTQSDGNTLFHVATQRNNLALLERLANFDIDVNIKNSEGYTALQIAAMKAEDDAIIKYLLAQGADKTVMTDFDETIFDLASENELLKNKELQFLHE